MGIILDKLPPMLRPGTRTSLAAMAVTACVLGVSACGGDDDAAGAPTASGLDVVAELYPLSFVAERVSAGVADVHNLTPAASEPHDLELTPRVRAELDDADLVVYLSGMIPAVDDAVAGSDHAFDVRAAARLVEHADDDHDDHTDDHDGTGHADGQHDGDGHEHGVSDPHFWLDPIRLADVADALAVRLGDASPGDADRFVAAAADLRRELEALDAEFASGLSDCARRELVTSHTAFGYLADRYALHQIGVAGLSPHEEPSPARLAEVSDLVREHGVSTIFHEVGVDDRHADTIATETGAAVAVLDPLETLSDVSPGGDYLAVMRANLESLRAGLECR